MREGTAAPPTFEVPMDEQKADEIGRKIGGWIVIGIAGFILSMIFPVLAKLWLTWAEFIFR